MKKYAFYLPQFHVIPENDMWWGKGFTEWTNVKKAKPLYKDHNQPKKPLNDYYYSLDDVETLKWQAELANRYCIDGMIFYHYYFCGKKLLEKPAELLLSHQEIPMNFFFCWANHSWIKSWEGSQELLIEQSYGSRYDWENHFQYLLSFFKDDRYLKINGKPVFMIFKPDFEEQNEYVEYLNKRCFDSGFKGILMIETRDSLHSISEATNNLCFLREPTTSLNIYRKAPAHFVHRVWNKFMKSLRKISYNYVEVFDGDEIFNYSLKKIKENSNVIRGLFFEWDNTPRHSYRGYVITPISKQTFMRYMDSIRDNEFLFINAWNEWAEGMMLEPTQHEGYKYLQWIKEWSELNENRTNGI